MSDKHLELLKWLADSRVAHRVLHHLPCKTSIESAVARAAAGAPGSVGAKALIVKRSDTGAFVLVVLPGMHKLQSEALRAKLGRFRFATPEEVAEISEGLAPGKIPPFAAPVFSKYAELWVDEAVPQAELIGFNAAHFEVSVVMRGVDYLPLVPQAKVMSLSEPAEL